MDLLKRVIINHAIEGRCAASKSKFGFISQCKEVINFNRDGNVSGHKEPIQHCTDKNCVHTQLKFTKYTNTEHYGHCGHAWIKQITERTKEVREGGKTSTIVLAPK